MNTTLIARITRIGCNTPAWRRHGTALLLGLAAAALHTSAQAQPTRAARPAAASTPPATPLRLPELPKALDIGGRLQLDSTRFGGVTTRDGRSASASYARRAELSVGWTIAEDWQLSATVGYEDDGLLLDSAALRWRWRENLSLRAGRIDPDVGLDNANSSSWTAAIERSAIFDLAPGVADSEEGFGLRADAHGPGWHASAGVYDKRSRSAVVGRAVWMHTWGGDGVLQLGGSAARTRGDTDNGRVRTRLGLRGVTEDPAGRRSDLAPSVALPRGYDGDTVTALELALQQGPWLLQAEWLGRRLDAVGGAPARRLSGHSVQLAWSPNGQARRHDERAARFGRPEGDNRRFGRWELFVRLDTLEGVDGLDAQVQTLGASWFLDRHWRVSANVVSNRSADPNAVGDRKGSGFVLRGQAVF
jgi:phosphate-selective porin OprO/OprP